MAFRFINWPAQQWLFLAVVFGVTPSYSRAESVDSLQADSSPSTNLLAPVTISIEATVDPHGRMVLAGRDAAVQLLVTACDASGRFTDVTRQVSYATSPRGMVNISARGVVTPKREGQATIRAIASGRIQASIQVVVTHLLSDLAVNFPNEVVPLFTKHGCNAGGCHGKSGGQNGFQLSLLGFEPAEDFEHLLKESRGRRLFPAMPKRSLLLRKATGAVPHGGGSRFEAGSPPYRVMRRWIEQCMPYGSADDPTLVRVQVRPSQRVMERTTEQQLAVTAHFSDGTTRCVTRDVQFESNDPELAEVNETGLVTTGQATGSVAVMVRYQTAVDVLHVTIPYGAEIDELPSPANFIDDFVFDRLRELGLPPSRRCRDEAFLRRARIDITGRLPTLEEHRDFLNDDSPDKRQRLVTRLLNSADYADYFANKWSAILRNKRDGQGSPYATYAFHDWLRLTLHENRPYDFWVRQVIAAAGRAEENPAVAWYHQVRDPSAQVEDMAQLFLGQRIQCAKCHHHPLERWSQEDYYGLAAFFSRVGRKPSSLGRNRESIFHNVGSASAQNPKTGSHVLPTPLGGPPLEVPVEADPRQRLMDWMVMPDNPFFARALVNRYWKHFFGRGIVEPEDDMRVTNPPSNPKLLDALADHFVASGYDLKRLVHTLCTSRIYSLDSEPNDFNRQDKQSFSRFYPRRLSAEVLLDAIDGLTGATSRFAGVPGSIRAVQLPDTAFSSDFLNVFGRPDSVSACECERSSDVNLAQCLHLLNSQEVRQKVGGPRASGLAEDQRDSTAKLSELYMLAFSREPTNNELRHLLGHLTKYEQDLPQAYEDILWAMVNTKEFLFNH